MFAEERRKVGFPARRKGAKKKESEVERRLILHAEDKSSGELLKHSI